MGLKINGRGVAAMRRNGADALEAKLNGAVVWPDTPVDPWPEKPYLKLANGERMQLLHAVYDAAPYPGYQGGRLTVQGGQPCSILYPDVHSAGAELHYGFAEGQQVEYVNSVFRFRDRNGDPMEPAQNLPDMPNTYAASAFYTEAEGRLCIGLWFGTVSDFLIAVRANGGVPGRGTTNGESVIYGVTEEVLGMFHAIAGELLRGGNL